MHNIILWTVTLLLSLSVYGADFGTPKVNCRLVDEHFVFDAEIDYQLTAIAREALENGVPLIMQVDLQLMRRGSWLWEEDLLNRHIRYRINYQHLSSLYWVTNLNNQIKQDFVTLEAAVTALGTLSDIPLLHRKHLHPRESYLFQLKTALDVDVLPLPLRPLAYINPAWHLSSEVGSCVISH